MEDSIEFVEMEVKEEPMDHQGSSSHSPSSSGVEGVRHPDRDGYLIIDPSDDLKKEVKEEPFEDHSYATLPTSSSRQTSGRGDLSNHSGDVKEEDVWVKDEPIEEVDPIAVNTTTFTPKPENTWYPNPGPGSIIGQQQQGQGDGIRPGMMAQPNPVNQPGGLPGPAPIMGPPGQPGQPGQQGQPGGQPLRNATQALQQLLQPLKNPSHPQQQSEVLQILRTHPPLMASFIRHREIQQQQRQQQQLQQRQQQP